MTDDQASASDNIYPDLPSAAIEESIDFTPRQPRCENIPAALLSRIDDIIDGNHQTPTTAYSAKSAGSARAEARKLAQDVEFWSTHLLWKSTVAAKLREVGEREIADTLDHCRSEASIKRCTQCGKSTVFWNRCDRLYCPACTPRLARERKESIEAWAQYIGQPKHVVLTCRNTGVLTRERVQWFKACFAKLRRTKFAQQKTTELYATDVLTRRPIERYSYPWLGGFYALEVTKEANGWHLHLHALVDAKFIDAVMLSREWARILGQDLAIVKVLDCRDKSYLQEVCKYVVKGDTLAKWSGADIQSFVKAFCSVRSFGVFGTLYKRRGEFRSMLDELQAEPYACPCGCTRFDILSPQEAAWSEAVASIPPPIQARVLVAGHPELALNLSSEFHRRALAR